MNDYHAKPVDPCPMCETSELLAVQSVTGSDRPSQQQVVCHGCDMSGPTAPTLALALGVWAEMPRNTLEEACPHMIVQGAKCVAWGEAT